MKNKKNKLAARRCFASIAAKARHGGAMGDRRKKRSKERQNHLEGW